MAGIADKIYDLVKETVESCGVTLWDVRFLKEGASHYLRLFIDKPDGISINDCTDVSHAVDPIIDEADPIDVSYYLEVCSCGVNRELTRDEHFKAMLTKPVKIKLYKAVDGVKEFTGTLSDFDGGVYITADDGKTIRFDKKEISKATLQEEL